MPCGNFLPSVFILMVKRKAMKTLFSLFVLLLCTFFPTNEKGFTLNGSISGFADGTKLYLEDVTSGMGQMMDSTEVKNGQFQFKGQLPEGVRKVWVRTKDFSDYKSFWLENAVIQFQAQKGKFRQAEIKGSATHSTESQFYASLTPYNKKVDSLQILRQKDTSKVQRALLKQQISQLEEQKKQQVVAFIQNNPNSILSIYEMNTWATTWGRELSTKLYDKLSPAIKKTPYGQNVGAYIALNQDIKIGGPFADFEQENLQDQKVKLSDYQGKVVLLDFWAAWCGPCRADNPKLLATYEEFHGKGFEVLGVSLDTRKEHLQEAVIKDKLPWTNVSDYKGDKNRAALIYGVTGIPDNFLIDKNGNIVARGLRGEQLKEKLKTLLP